MLNDVATQRLLDAIYHHDKIKSVETEFVIQVDKYFVELSEARGKNLMERIKNNFYDHPFVAVIAIIMTAIVGIAAFLAAIRGL